MRAIVAEKITNGNQLLKNILGIKTIDLTIISAKLNHRKTLSKGVLLMTSLIPLTLIDHDGQGHPDCFYCFGKGLVLKEVHNKLRWQVCPTCRSTQIIHPPIEAGAVVCRQKYFGQ